MDEMGSDTAAGCRDADLSRVAVVCGGLDVVRGAGGNERADESQVCGKSAVEPAAFGGEVRWAGLGTTGAGLGGGSSPVLSSVVGSESAGKATLAAGCAACLLGSETGRVLGRKAVARREGKEPSERERERG